MIQLPLLLSQACKSLNFTNFDKVGQCFVEQVFFGDLTLASVFILIPFAILLVRFGFPLETMLPVAMALFFTLYLLSGSMVMLGLFIVCLLIGGGLLMIALLSQLNR